MQEISNLLHSSWLFLHLITVQEKCKNFIDFISNRCPLVKTKGRVWFVFQKIKYIWNGAIFEPLGYPYHKFTQVQHYKAQLGLDDENITNAKTTFGLNRFEVPIPSFQELFKEHMVAPFFVFQLFCVALWFLDEVCS